MIENLVSITIAIACITMIVHHPLSIAFNPRNSFGQAEEAFSGNVTFFQEELEQIQRQMQTASPVGQSSYPNNTGGQTLEMSSQGQTDRRHTTTRAGDLTEPDAHIVISGQNTYIAWETNETGNSEIMLRTSNDNGQTFGEKINLSNSTQTDSGNLELAAFGEKVYAIWYENLPSDGTSESVMRISNDGGRTFGPVLKLSDPNAIGESPTFLTYVNSTFGIELRYPSDWQVMAGVNEIDETAIDSVIDIAGFFSQLEHRLDSYEERVWISVDNLRSENITLEEYSNEVINSKNQSLDNFRLLDYDTDSTILAGYPAYRLIYNSTIGDGTILKQLEIGTKIGDKVYYIDYYAEHDKYAGLLPVVQEMINSLKVQEEDY